MFRDDGGTVGTEWNEIQDGDETGIRAVEVSIYYDTDSNGVANSYDPVWGSVRTNSSGGYTFTDLPDGNYVIVVDENNVNIPDGYTLTSSNSHAFSLDPNGLSSGSVEETNIDVGFGPVLKNDQISGGEFFGL